MEKLRKLLEKMQPCTLLGSQEELDKIIDKLNNVDHGITFQEISTENGNGNVYIIPIQDKPIKVINEKEY